MELQKLWLCSGRLTLADNSFIYATITPLQMQVNQINIVPKWQFNFTDNYIISDCNKVVNLKTRKILRMQLKGYTKGYYLHGKFYSLQNLRTKLIKIKRTNYPF